MKRCSRCKTEKPRAAFHKCSSKKSGLQSFCKSCKTTYGQSPAQKASKKLYAQGAGRPRHQAACRRYNPSSKGRAAYARYNKSPKGRATNLHHCRLRQVRCTNAAHDPGAIKEFYFELRTRARVTCFWCDKLVPKHERHGDHVVPLSKGGPHCISNLVPACAPCNISRGNRYA